MDINSVSNIQQANISKAQNKSVENQANQNTKEIQNNPKTVEDTIAINGNPETQNPAGIYTKEDILNNLENAEKERTLAFVDTLKKMLLNQDEYANIASTENTPQANLTIMGEDYYVSEEQSAEALKAISEGGEYSIGAVADRIMEFAEAIAGDDPEKVAEMRKSVEKGFEAAYETLGLKKDEMPQITRDTYDEIMKRFDEWEQKVAPQDTPTEPQNDPNKMKNSFEE